MKKNILFVMFICLLSMYNPACFANPLVTNDGETINILSDNKINKIKWEKEFIDFMLVDNEKITKAKNEGIDTEKIYNQGLSGDFMSFSQKRFGKIKTTFGEYDIVWTFNPEKGYLSFICNESICQPLRVKQTEGNKGIIFGHFQNFISSNNNVLEIPSSDFIGLTFINLKNLFESKPNLTINNIKDPKDYKIKWESKENTLTNGAIEKIGYISDLKETMLKIIKNNNQQALTLEDGTRVFTKETSSSDKIELFYLNFNNNKNPDYLEIVGLGFFDKNDFK